MSAAEYYNSSANPSRPQPIPRLSSSHAQTPYHASASNSYAATPPPAYQSYQPDPQQHQRPSISQTQAPSQSQLPHQPQQWPQDKSHLQGLHPYVQQGQILDPARGYPVPPPHQHQQAYYGNGNGGYETYNSSPYTQQGPCATLPAQSNSPYPPRHPSYSQGQAQGPYIPTPQQSYTPIEYPPPAPSPYLSPSPDQHHHHHHHHHSHHKKEKEKSRGVVDTFLGAGGGAIIGDAIFPGLGTVGGALLGGYVGKNAADRKKGRSRSRSSNRSKSRSRSRR